MEKVYTALNADKLKPGDKVIVANNLADLRNKITQDIEAQKIGYIASDDEEHRFAVVGSSGHFALAYLVERAENCTNCVHRECEACKPDVSPTNCCVCYDREVKQSYIEAKIEQEAESPKYRPFNGTGELIQAWVNKGGKWQKRELTMPNIWVMYKERGNKELITVFKGDNIISTEFQQVNMQGLFKDFTFLDGSPCGVEVVE